MPTTSLNSPAGQSFRRLPASKRFSPHLGSLMLLLIRPKPPAVREWTSERTRSRVLTPTRALMEPSLSRTPSCFLAPYFERDSFDYPSFESVFVGTCPARLPAVP